MHARSFEDFILEVATRESKNRYDCTNLDGDLGRYQFSKYRLIDLKLMNRNGKWCHGLNEKEFLAHHQLQDMAFKVHVGQIAKKLRKKHSHLFNTELHGVTISLSGMIGVVHLQGIRGLEEWLETGYRVNPLGTTCNAYMTKFNNFDIPYDLPLKIPFSKILHPDESFVTGMFRKLSNIFITHTVNE